MVMANDRWDIKAWIISILLGLVLTFGGYNISTVTKDIERVKQITTELEIRQAVDDARFLAIQNGIEEVKSQVKDIRDLLLKSHVPSFKR